MQIIDILLIDDDEDYCREVKNQLRSIGIDEYGYDIIVKYFRNLKDGFAELEKDSKYKALILDAKAFITPEQEKEEFDFIVEALSRLEETNRKTGRIHIPFAVNTGYTDHETLKAVKTRIENQKGKLFDKSKQAEEMLQYLLEEIDKTENTKIEKQYADVFEVFDKGCLDASLRNDLINILKKLDDEAAITDNFTPLRKLLEEIYKKLITEGIIPNNLVHSDGRPNLEWIYYYLKGYTRYPNPGLTNPNPTQEKHLLSCLDYLKNITSIITHAYSHDVSKYAYKSAIFALLEILLWFKKLMQ